ncbi:hypothetical protein D3C87_1130860 [compost metagenome]
MTVGRDHVIRMEHSLAVFHRCFPHHLSERFHVHLVDDPRARRDDAEVVEAPLCPLDETVALAVAAKIDVQILVDGIGFCVTLDDHRVVDRQHGRDQRIHRFRIAAQLRHHIPHSCEVSQCRQASGVVKHQAVGLEWHFAVRTLTIGTRQHRGQRLRRATRDVFQKDANRVRQLRYLYRRQHFVQIDVGESLVVDDQMTEKVTGRFGHALKSSRRVRSYRKGRRL